MHIILGGTGHVGSSVAQELLKAGEQVTIISHDKEKAADWKAKGATIAVADVYNTAELHDVFCTGQRLFLLNPPAAPSTDTVAEEQKTLASILNALKGSGIKKVVAESTYGAQPGEGKGDLNVLYDMEQALMKMELSVTIIRAAYYMSNWDMYLPKVQKDGEMPSFYPADFNLPMVAPGDIGKVAARLMIGSINESALHYVEGPQACSPNDVATAFAAALGKPVKTVVIPRSGWKQAYKEAGFSDAAADSYAAMTGITLDKVEFADEPIKGSTTIEEYINGLVKSAGK